MSAPPCSDEVVQLCAFQVGATEYVIDLMRIDEILMPQTVTPLAEAPAWVEGVINLRGTLIPVVNLRSRLGTREPSPDRVRPRWVVAFVGRRRVALSVDGVNEVVRVRRSDLEPVPESLASSHPPAVIGVCGPAGTPKLLLELKSLLRRDG